MRDEHGRAVGSCNLTCGMPSSHAAMAIGFLVLVIYDGIVRVVPSSSALQGQGEEFPTCSPMLSVTPLSRKAVMHHTEFLGYFTTWMLLLCPVPLMRVRLNDHSASQVLIGSLLGGVYAILWFNLVRWLSIRYRSQLGNSSCWGLITHNYSPVAFRIEAEKAGYEAVRLEAIRIVDAPLEELRSGSEAEDTE
ncbi:unnamed protein product [Polarella glacialis]|uniref:Dolichyldiphosphatase n=1 Tax=Polarella glacialis TaxID=89957 RepID=A0A813IXY8_POLGL|nr:unnamed protein product [Polarella glacialis]